ncbi:hypothetical protein [Oricola thermophila]|uniref:Uncharacterized protein n=1 Tax=Oricola thermophila TaxID=2742145 RepID=A0A6N1VKK7_9HYPH|nr:hypothetical protein [Oricola thermophila]QKV19477.1 hypothetical protein HTY61_13940 [Oricola thermophila]
MKSYSPSLADLRAAANQSTPAQIALEWLIATDFEELHKLVERAIDWISQEMSKTCHLRQERSEDQISIDFVGMLKSMGLNAAHDTQYGGHCDIIVEGRNEFLWIGEAKIHSSYSWLEKGMHQLSTRYSTGLQGQDTGEILIYTYDKRLDRILKAWRERLIELVPDIEVDEIDMEKLIFRSTHIHENTGRLFRVRHKGITLHFDPKA